MTLNKVKKNCNILYGYILLISNIKWFKTPFPGSFCTKFYLCSNNALVILTCPTGLLFDAVLMVWFFLKIKI